MNNKTIGKHTKGRSNNRKYNEEVWNLYWWKKTGNKKQTEGNIDKVKQRKERI